MAIRTEHDILMTTPTNVWPTPKHQFGDADTYIYESADDVLDVFVAGSIHTRFNASSLDHYLTVKTDVINEHTAAAGVTIDGLLIKDGVVTGYAPLASPTFTGSVSFPLNQLIYATGSYKMFFRSTTHNFSYSGTTGWQVNNNADTIALLSVLDNGNTTVYGTVTAPYFIAGGTATDQYFLRGYRGANETLHIYDNSSDIYFDSWDTMAFRVNALGGSGGSFSVSGGNMIVSNPVAGGSTWLTVQNYQYSSGANSTAGLKLAIFGGGREANIYAHCDNAYGQVSSLRLALANDTDIMTDRLTILMNGHVGIGVTPSYRLHVVSDLTANDYKTVAYFQASGAFGGGARIHLGSTNDGSYFESNSGYSNAGQRGESSYGDLNVVNNNTGGTYGAINLYTNATNRFKIGADGVLTASGLLVYRAWQDMNAVLTDGSAQNRFGWTNTNIPGSGGYGGYISFGTPNDKYGAQIFIDYASPEFYYRQINNGTTYGWKRLANTDSPTFTGVMTFGGTDNCHAHFSSDAPFYGHSISTTTTGGGGWARGYRFNKHSDGAQLGGFGGMGNVNDISYLWIGRDYNDYGIAVYPDAAVELYYDYSKKFETYASGTKTIGHHHVKGVGNNVYFDSTGMENSHYIGVVNDYNLRLYCGRGTGTMIDLNNNGSIDLYFGSNKKFETVTGGVSITGTVTATSSMTATNFALSSDLRYKQNIMPIKVSPVDIEYKSFELIKEPWNKRYGVIAQELEEKYPELVRKDDHGMLSVVYIDLFVKEIAYLKNKVKELEGRLN